MLADIYSVVLSSLSWFHCISCMKILLGKSSEVKGLSLRNDPKTKQDFGTILVMLRANFLLNLFVELESDVSVFVSAWQTWCLQTALPRAHKHACFLLFHLPLPSPGFPAVAEKTVPSDMQTWSSSLSKCFFEMSSSVP